MALLRSLSNFSKSLSVSTFISRLVFGRATFERPQKASLQSLPNELLLEIFSFLELKPYIICHSVCKNWRDLLPSTQIHPIRKRLLDLYRCILETPDFQKTLEWTDHNLQPLDREEYIRCLFAQYSVIPEEYRMWILEWPARLMIQCTWPGLPFIQCRTISSISRRNGVNWISYRSFSPRLSGIVYKLRTPAQTVIPGLLIWRCATSIDWLVFAEDVPGLFGRVVRTDQYYHDTGSIPYYPCHEHTVEDEENSDTASDTASEDYDYEAYPITFEDWISYLEHLWDSSVRDIRLQSTVYHSPDYIISQPVRHRFDGHLETVLPGHIWDSRCDHDGFRRRSG